MACRRTREHSDLENVAVVSTLQWFRLPARSSGQREGASTDSLAPPVEPSPNEIWIASGSRRR